MKWKLDVLLCHVYSLNACSLGEENGLFSEESNETQAVSRNYEFMSICHPLCNRMLMSTLWL